MINKHDNISTLQNITPIVLTVKTILATVMARAKITKQIHQNNYSQKNKKSTGTSNCNMNCLHGQITAN